MAEMAITKNRPFLAWTINVCNVLWKYIVVPFWVLVVLAGAVSGLVAWLGDHHQFAETFKWMHDNLSLVIIIAIVLVFLSILIGIVRILPVQESEWAAKRHYLKATIREKSRLNFGGIPAGYAVSMVKLEDVFIPLQFHSSEPLDVFGPEPEDIALRRRLLTSERDEQETAQLLQEHKRIEQLKAGGTISMGELWTHLTNERPVAVIQGFAGAGKSTLMRRLALHAARLCVKQRDIDPSLTQVKPALIPLFVSLGDYQHRYKAGISLLAFIQEEAKKAFIDSWVEQWLKNGMCLVLLDALDEVNEEKIRKGVQNEIRTFCDMFRSDDERKRTYNRFLITSRVSGYDIKAFKDYCPHYLIADLNEEQIAAFLPRWCEFNVPTDAPITHLEAKDKADRFMRAMQENAGVRKLAEIPLLLTLLASMQQKGVHLPRSRAQLYKTVTRTMLEERNEPKGRDPLAVTTAIDRLGPVAYKMHSEGNDFERRLKVITVIEHVIREEQNGIIVEGEAERYLDLISQQGGLFVKRAGDQGGDFYGFFHRTFKEYFAARYLLAQIEVHRDQSKIDAFVNVSREPEDTWREPYLLGVASKSDESPPLASELIRTLVHTPASADAQSVVHDVVLATTAIVESDSERIYPDVQREVAHTLLQCYTQALQAKRFDDCEKIENVLRDWLLSLRDTYERPPVLLVLREVISDATNTMLQRSTLTLLAMIAQQLAEGTSTIFTMLVPILLQLADLPDVPEFQKPHDLTPSANFDIIDLALTTLSFMGRRGPAGVLVVQARQDFSAYLAQLALYSLESSTLITPTIVPLTEGNYREYERAVEQWLMLRDRCKKHGITEKDIQVCSDIHASLFVCAEEVRYPTIYHLLNMLQASKDGSDWQACWQYYMLDVLQSGKYVDYQQITLLWAMLFPEREMTTLLVLTIMEHLTNTNMLLQCKAQRFTATLAENLRYRRYWRYPRYLTELRYLRELLDWDDLRDLSYLRDLSEWSDLRELRDLRSIDDWRKHRDISDIGDLKDLRELILIPEVSKNVMKALPVSNTVQYVDLLTILLGRVLQIQTTNEENTGPVEYEEIEHIAQCAKNSFLSATDDMVKGAALDILRYLPVRSAAEITFVIQFVQAMPEEQIQGACGSALRRASGNTPEKKAALEVGKASSIEVVRDAVEYALS